MKDTDYGARERESILALNKEGLPFSLVGITTKEHMPCSTGNSTFGICTSGTMTTFMEMHPYMWSKEDVSVWLGWCRKEYALSDVPMEKFSMNGKALCVLTKEDFKERAPNVGDVLFNTLQQFASTNLHPSLRNGLSHLFPQMATSSGLLMPAAAAAAMCNTFIPAAHLQHLLGQAYPAPMTPESSPSAPSVSSNSTPPRTVTPVSQDSRPTIVVTQPSEERVTAHTNSVAKIPVGVLDVEPRTPSPCSTRSVHSSPRRPSPVDLYRHHNGATEASNINKQDRLPSNPEGLPLLQKEQATKSEAKSAEDEPLNLSRRPSESAPTPSPPLLTPHVKSEPPPMPGSGLQAALRAYLPRHINSTSASRQFLMVPGTQQVQALSPSSVPVVIQKINQSGGEMTVSPDPKFAVNHYSSVQDLVKKIKKEPESESELPQQYHNLAPRYRGSPLAENLLARQKVNTPVTTPRTPSYDPISPCEDEDTDLETPFSPPITPGGTLLGFTPGTPNGAISPGRPDGTGKLLWEFLSELLNDPVHQSDPKPIVRWIDLNTFTFQILDTHRLSSLWGQQKNRGTMNYEKLSRALRYYKKVGIIEKATGKRLTYKFMKPPSSIKRGQRGARPGVPRKNRRQSLLQSQQSVNEEMNSSPQRNVGDQTPTTSTVSTPYSIAHMPQFMASGTLKTPLHQMMSQRNEAAMALAGMSLPAGNVAMLAGLPIVLPPSSALRFNGALNDTVNGSPVPQPLVTSAKISSQAAAKFQESEDTAGETKEVSEQSASDSEREASTGDKSGDEAGNEKEETVDSDIKNHSDQDKYFSNDNSSKAVHLGMPRPVPTYNPNAKSKSKSLLNSLSKRRLMSSGDGNTPKKMPRLILPKQTEKVKHMNNNNHISEESEVV